MFKPRFELSSRILASITAIERLTLSLRQIFIPQEVLEHTKRECLVALTHFSTQIEGNHLSLEQVSGVVEKNKTYGHIRDEKEVKNYFHLLEKLPALKKTHDAMVNLKLITDCHAALLNGIVEKSLSGKLRDIQNAIYEAGSDHLVYLPPEPADVKQLILDLCEWVHDSKEHPILLAAVFHNQLVTIHPFVDGNGRSARLLSLYLLESRGYDWRQMVPIDRHYAADRPLYYRMLQQNYSHNYYEGRNETDFTNWIEYYTEGLKIILEGTLNQVELFKAQNVLMNNRQSKILATLQTAKFVTASSYAARFGISTRMATRDLKQLIEWNKLATIGKARATKYFLK